MLIIVDGHEDIALNVLADGRNYLTSAHKVRENEKDTTIPEEFGQAMLGLNDWVRGKVAVVFATIAVIPRTLARQGEMSYLTTDGAYQQALAQLDLYKRWDHEHSNIQLITTRAHLDEVLISWEKGGNPKVGFVLLMENADPIRHPSELDEWVDRGLRIIGPAWHRNQYTGSTSDFGPLTMLGQTLLDEMQKFNLVLDISHMADEAVEEAFRRFDGTIIASHANLRRVLPMYRMLPDEFVKAIADRNGVVGLMPASWAIDASWKEHRDRTRVSLKNFVEVVDMVCQLTGNADHVAIGSDFDGGFGCESVPHEIDTVAELALLVDALIGYGFSEADTRKITSGNWLRILRNTLP